MKSSFFSLFFLFAKTKDGRAKRRGKEKKQKKRDHTKMNKNLGGPPLKIRDDDDDPTTLRKAGKTRSSKKKKKKKKRAFDLSPDERKRVVRDEGKAKR